jgi:alpha,alpha-trehalose phosphorylase
MTQRHLVQLVLRGHHARAVPAPLVMSSQLLNRQDGEDEYHVRAQPLSARGRPAQAGVFDHRVLVPKLQRHDRDHGRRGEVMLGYQCANSGMTLACSLPPPASRRAASTRSDLRQRRPGQDRVHGSTARPANTVRLEVRVVPLLHRGARRGARRPLPPHARSEPALRRRAPLPREQRAWLDDYWGRTDVEIAGDEPASSRRCGGTSSSSPGRGAGRGQGIPAKGLTGVGVRGSLLLGHRDLRHAVPHLHDAPIAARNLLRFRHADAARGRRRARELNQRGRCSRGARSTGRRPPPTTRPAPRSTTSTPTSRTR